MKSGNDLRLVAFAVSPVRFFFFVRVCLM